MYITKDKDGKEIKREVVDGKVTGGSKDMTYTTGKVDKDGYKLVKVENPVGDPSYDKDGKETKGNYKPGVTQEITYVYEKTESELTPLEPSEPVEPKKPEEPNKLGKVETAKPAAAGGLFVSKKRKNK
ncbi:MAG: MucBP domain-containing protein [Anaerococcus hydrogenalis]|nr:MucBP domain-containing protein [Anaerococcus hydrogenalis]